MCRKLCLFIVFLLFFISAPCLSFAEEIILVSGQYGVWHYQCTYPKYSLSSDAHRCFAGQKTGDPDSNFFKGMIWIEPVGDYGQAKAEEKRKWNVMVGLPSSFSLVKMPFLKVDHHILIPLKWRYNCGPKACVVICGRKGCLAKGEIYKSQLDKIKKGHILTFEPEHSSESQQQKVDFEVDDDGMKAISRVEEWVARSPFR